MLVHSLQTRTPKWFHCTEKGGGGPYRWISGMCAFFSFFLLRHSQFQCFSALSLTLRPISYGEFGDIYRQSPVKSPDIKNSICRTTIKIFECSFGANFFTLKCVPYPCPINMFIQYTKHQWYMYRPGVSNLLAQCAKFLIKIFEWAVFDQQNLWCFVRV